MRNYTYALVVISLLGNLSLEKSLYSQNSLADIIGDVTLPHEGKPHGVPENWDWACQPRAGMTTPPDSWTAAIAWGQVYEWAEGNPATNTRVQIKDIEMYYLSRTDSSWHVLQQTTLVEGAAYREDFANDESRPADIRSEPGGSLSIMAGNGYNFHFWPASGRTEFPANDVIGCFVTVQARLILDDPEGVDDRSSAKYLMSVGGDWWESLNAVWDNWTTNADMGIGRFRFVTPEWKSFNMISIPTELAVRIPPPFLTEVTSTSTRSERNFQWYPPFPNPFHQQVQFTYELSKSARVTISMIDGLGKSVGNIWNTWQPAGKHQLNYDTTKLVPGPYMLRVQLGEAIYYYKLLKLN